jgi:cyclic dehypoxanthinyl futalosine synthase
VNTEPRSDTTRGILDRAARGDRISRDEALHIYRRADLLDMGLAALARRRAIHGDAPVTFLIDRNINYTNVCLNRCRFCAFYRDAQSPEAFLLSHDEIETRVREAVAAGATQVMLQGGIHPEIGLDWFLELFSRIKNRCPVHLHSLSPPEIHFLSTAAGCPVPEVLGRLMEAGLDSLPGGGAEILADHVRRRISPRKILTRQWLSVMEDAHRLGLPTTATMMIGAGEAVEDRIDHLARIRALQDKTAGFISFIPWTFQPANTELATGGATTFDYLRTLALARLFLDNIRNVQGSWVTQGPEIGQLSLEFGANDLGSIMLEENVVRAAGTSHHLEKDEMVRLIVSSGNGCARRNTLFHILEVCGKTE